jgi:prepilin-type processing-associated H-X9-DG protein
MFHTNVLPDKTGENEETDMMILEKCPTSAELQALSLGQLSDEASDEMLGHLQNCATCQAELATADPLDDTLVRQLRESESDPEFSDEKECRLALVKALGTLAQANTQSLDDAELSNLLPKVLGEYEIVRPIGRGGMGNVYLARHSKLGRQVALKVLSSHRLLQPRMRQRFETEMRAVGGLSHPNIVTAHDAREVDQIAVLVTEYIDGLDVGQILRRCGKLSVGDACEIARQIALALEYVDQQGLVHRDIKPSNVMIGRAGEVKLLDLGLARLQLGDDDRPEMTATGQAMGTADYIAPEQVNDSRHVDIRADIYALGCTLFKMLSGQPPFDDDRYPTTFAKMTAHVSDQPPALQKMAEEIPPQLAKLVQQMIAKDPGDRPQTPKEVAELLAKFSNWADLQRLVDQAIQAGDLPGQPPRKTTSKPLALQTEPKPFLQRSIPVTLAIAAGFLGLMIGFALGVIITIKHADGKVTQVEIPDGTSAKVSEDGNIEVDLSGGNQQAMNKSKGPGDDEQMIMMMPTGFSHSQNDLKQIAIGLQNHQDTYKEYPAAVNTNKENAKPFSWRVAILPMMNQQALFDQYHFDEEWDSDNNLKVLAQMPDVFRGETAEKDSTETHYLAVTGPETVISDKPVRMWDVKDGTANTIMVVETKKAVPWTKPEDLAYASDAALPELTPIYKGGFNAAFADGSVRFIKENVDEKSLRAMFTRSGNDEISIEASGSDAAASFSEATSTKEKMTDLDRMQGVWKVVDFGTAQPFPGQFLVAFSGLEYILTQNNEPIQIIPFSISHEGKFSSMTLEGPNSLTSSTMQAVVWFNENDELVMQTESTRLRLKRLAHLPLSEGELKKIEQNPETLLLAKTVKMIAAYQETGEMPISAGMASVKEAARQMRSRNNLKQIGLALHNYQDAFREFPAARIEMQDGKQSKPYSWRVAILPFIEGQALYEQYRFDEDWDSENNLKILAQMPGVFRDPQAKEDSTDTRYLAIVGRETVIGDKPTKIRDILDGTANTIMIVETKKSVPWTKPEDIEYSTDAAFPELTPIYTGGFDALISDGSVRFIKSETDEKTLRAMFTRAGGETDGF